MLESTRKEENEASARTLIHTDTSSHPCTIQHSISFDGEISCGRLSETVHFIVMERKITNVERCRETKPCYALVLHKEALI